MPMPPQFQKAFLAFLKTKGVVRPDDHWNITCSVCGGRNLTVGVVEGVKAPAIICDSCGHALMFDPVRTGLDHPV